MSRIIYNVEGKGDRGGVAGYGKNPYCAAKGNG
jgi:hypothetical protein